MSVWKRRSKNEKKEKKKGRGKEKRERGKDEEKRKKENKKELETEKEERGVDHEVGIQAELLTEDAAGLGTTKDHEVEREGEAGMLNTWDSARHIVKVLVAQLCLTLWDLVDCSLPGSSVRGILQARILIPFSRESSWPRDRTRVSCIAGGFFTIWATREAPKY